MSLEGALVHQPAAVTDRNALLALPEGLVVADSPTTDIQTLSRVYAAARQDKGFDIPADRPAYLLSAGPLLDSADGVSVRSLVRRETRLELEVVYTKTSAQGLPVLRNMPWRPLVQVPVVLPAGRYDIAVSWRALSSLPDGPPLERSPLVQTAVLRLE